MSRRLHSSNLCVAININMVKKSSKRIVKKIIEALREKAPLNNNRGPVLRGGPEKTGIHSNKDKKRKGRVEGRIINDSQMKWKEIHELGIIPINFWDDWLDERDGFRHGTVSDQLYHKWRGCSCANKEKVYAQNHKLIKQIKIREARKLKKNM